MVGLCVQLGLIARYTGCGIRGLWLGLRYIDLVLLSWYRGCFAIKLDYMLVELVCGFAGGVCRWLESRFARLVLL